MSDFLTEDDLKFKKQLLIDADIKDELKKQASMLFYVGAALTEVEDYYERMKHELSLKESALTLTIRKSAKLDKEKINESNINERVKVQESYNAQYTKYLKAKKALSAAKNRYKAQLEKGENLRSLAFMKQAQLRSVIDEKIKGD
jgi:hypothetical protein